MHETHHHECHHEHHSKTSGEKVFLIVLGAVVLMFLSGAAGYFLYEKLNQSGQLSSTGTSTEEVGTTTENTTAVQNGDVVWEASPEELNDLGIIKRGQNGPNGEEATLVSVRYYKVGSFVEEKYKGGDLISLYAGCDGICMQDDLFRFVRMGSKFTLLKKHSTSLEMNPYVDATKFDVDETYEIKSLLLPNEIYGPGTRQILKTASFGAFGLSYSDEFFNVGNLRKVFTNPAVGDVYTTRTWSILRPENMTIFDRNGFYVRGPDGTTQIYELKIDFLNDDIPNITWEDGTKNNDLYFYYDRGGCGSTNYAAVMSNTFDPMDVNRDLKPAGHNSKGDTIYVLKNANHSLLQEVYKNVYVPEGQTKPTYAEFVAQHPLFFWVDPFGRLIKFTSNKYAPPAECGKPVIYLYPETPTDVFVKLAPQGGFSYTEPEYGNGWLVRAEPDGNLTELSSGKNYPYLFWEGRGGIYQTPEKGFVVARAGVHNFLVEKLTKLGVNQKETADFLEFWEPRMQSAPYYFVTFLGTQAMNNIAPITVTPKPDTVIRILMDFLPLEKPVEVEGFEIKTPVRRGFTVVEWGGVLR